VHSGPETPFAAALVNVGARIEAPDLPLDRDPPRH
jgi:hypothetical protein